jgi:hypothetical protein
MTFEEKIINNSKIRQSKLLRPAKIASEKPDTGVKILKKGAYYLIKDSADITIQYLAHLCYGSFNDPLKDLKGKFTEAEIIDFVGRSKEEKYTNQLLNIILTDVGSSQVSSITDSPIEVEEDEEVDISIEDDYEDVYGDYEVETASATTKAATVKTELVDVTDTTGVINKLIEVFAAK